MSNWSELMWMMLGLEYLTKFPEKDLVGAQKSQVHEATVIGFAQDQFTLSNKHVSLPIYKVTVMGGPDAGKDYAAKPLSRSAAKLGDSIKVTKNKIGDGYQEVIEERSGLQSFAEKLSRLGGREETYFMLGSILFQLIRVVVLVICFSNLTSNGRRYGEIFAHAIAGNEGLFAAFVSGVSLILALVVLLNILQQAKYLLVNRGAARSSFQLNRFNAIITLEERALLTILSVAIGLASGLFILSR